MIEPREIPDANAVALHYDELDHWYRTIWGEHVHHGIFTSRKDTIPIATERLIDVLSENLELTPGQTVCDVGCGYGGTARYLANRRGVRVTGMTVSKAQAAYANACDSHNIEIHAGDFLTNEFADRSFDAVYSVESTEHFSDKPELFVEMNRILKPGGRVAVFAWLARERPGPVETRLLLEPICREGRLPCMGTRAEYETFLREAGFIDVQYADYSRRVSRTWTLVVRRIAMQLLRDPAARAFLRSGAHNLVFGWSLLRIRAAYACGAMRYGLITARKPEVTT
jgi:tocopherol O-methyltransferase